MRPLLKALGLTIWGLIAFGLLIVFCLVGYQAVVKIHGAGVSVVDTHESGGNSAGPPAASRSDSGPITGATPAATRSAQKMNPLTADTTHAMLHNAAGQHRYDMVVEYGKELFDAGNAGPDDLVIVAQSHYALSDCASALTWVERAELAFHEAAKEPDEELHRIRMRCAQDSNRPPIKVDPSHRERFERLLRALKERAEADRRDLPRFEAEASKSLFGELDVKLGEIYFGFGDYGQAIAAISRGLEKGQIKYLDDAYVYLGLSEQAVGNIPEARKAFAKLKDVPDISPRVLMLWELYAETEL